MTEDYANQASRLLQRGVQEDVPLKIAPKSGMIRMYDPETKTFGAYNATGTTRTFYMPDPCNTATPLTGTTGLLSPEMNLSSGLRMHLCLVCGFGGLQVSPWADGEPSDEICPSCGTHFGYDDVAGGRADLRERIYLRRRLEWIKRGSPWYSASRRPPADWDASAQLAVFD